MKKCLHNRDAARLLQIFPSIKLSATNLATFQNNMAYTVGTSDFNPQMCVMKFWKGDEN